MANMYTFNDGDLVFAKCKGFPPWPARVDINANVGKVGKNKMAVFFFGTHEVGSVAVKDMLPYNVFKDKLGKPQNRKGFTDALWEIEHKPKLAIDEKVVEEKPPLVEDIKSKSDGKKEWTKKLSNRKGNFVEEVKVPEKSVYSDFDELDSDSNDLIIDENVVASKAKLGLPPRKSSAKRKFEDEPFNSKLLLKSRKKPKIAEATEVIVESKKKDKRATKKAIDSESVKLKIKIQPKPTVANNFRLTNVRSRTRFESRVKQSQVKSPLFERKDYLEDTRSRSRHSLLEHMKQTSTKQPEQNIDNGLDSDEINEIELSDTDLKASNFSKDTLDKKKGSKSNVSKAVSNKREAKVEVKEKPQDVEEPMVMRTRCGRIVRTPAALDRDEEIIDLPGFKRNFYKQIKKEIVASKLDLPQTVSSLKNKDSDRKPFLRLEDEAELPESNATSLVSKVEKHEEEQLEKKLVMTISKNKISKFTAGKKKRNAVEKVTEKAIQNTEVDDENVVEDLKSENKIVEDLKSENKIVDEIIPNVTNEDANIAKEDEATVTATSQDEPLEDSLDDCPDEKSLDDAELSKEKVEHENDEETSNKLDVSETETTPETMEIADSNPIEDTNQSNSPTDSTFIVDKKETEQDKESVLQKRRAEKEEEKNRKKREKYEKKKRDKLNRMKIEEKLIAIDQKIKDSLVVGVQDIDQCLEAMIELDTLTLNSTLLKANPDVVITIRKCRKYKNSDFIRQKADDLYFKFKDMFFGGDGDSFSFLFERNPSGRTSSKSLSTDTELDNFIDSHDLSDEPAARQEPDSNRLPSLPVGACVPVSGVSKGKRTLKKSGKESNKKTASAVDSGEGLQSTSSKDSGTKPKKR